MKNITTFCTGLQNSLPASSFFLFHDIKSKSLEEPDPKEKEEPEGAPFNDNHDIA